MPCVGFHVLVERCDCRCLTSESEGRWTGECDCGGPLSGGSGPGDQGCAPLQRVNTYTTCTDVSTLAAHRISNKSSSCRVLLPANHHGHSAYYHQTHQQQQLQQANYSSSGRNFQPSRDTVAGRGGRCCSSCQRQHGQHETPQLLAVVAGWRHQQHLLQPGPAVSSI